MISLRAWLVSGTFAAGLGAGMLCGAGVAAADAGRDSGTVRSSAHESAHESAGAPRPDRGVSRAARVVPAQVERPAPKSAKAKPAAAGTGKVPAAAVVPAAAAVAAQPAAAKTGPVVPSSVPVDPAKFAGTYYEQGSVKQFFSIGLVNTKATYTLNPDGTIKVQNSGNYFFNRGPRSSITGSAVAVNETNTALNVGFFSPRPPSATPPGNYTILENAPDYSWVLVSDPSGQSGYILTRSKTISATEYQQFVDQSKSLGVKGRITPTRQF